MAQFISASPYNVRFGSTSLNGGIVPQGIQVQFQQALMMQPNMMGGSSGRSLNGTLNDSIKSVGNALIAQGAQEMMAAFSQNGIGVSSKNSPDVMSLLKQGGLDPANLINRATGGQVQTGANGPLLKNGTGLNGAGNIPAPTGVPGTSGAGAAMLTQAAQRGQITFDPGSQKALTQAIGDVLDRSPSLMKAYQQELANGNTYSFGLRTGGGASFTTLNTNQNRTEFNTEDFQRAPYGAPEVIVHELTHSIYDVDHGPQHNAYIMKYLQEGGFA